MIDLSKDIHSLTDFKRRTNEFVQQIKQTKHPLVLTVNGKAELVVQDAESYQRLLEAAEFVKTIRGICQGLEQMNCEERQFTEEVFVKLSQKLGIINDY